MDWTSPYLGYVEMELEVAGVRLAKVVVLVVKDNCLTVSRLLGMNVLKQVWELLVQDRTLSAPINLVTANAQGKVMWKQALRICQCEHAFARDDGQVGFVRFNGRRPVKIAGLQEVLLSCRGRNGPDGRSYEALVEPMDMGTGLLVAHTLVTVHDGRMQVRVRNLRHTPVVLQRYQKLGTLHLIKAGDVYAEGPDLCTLNENVVEVRLQRVDTVVQESVRQQIPAVDLEGVEILDWQRQRLEALLLKHRAVFSEYEKYYGCTGTVLHPIPTGQTSPVRQRYRSIPPNLYAEVKLLLRGMLQGGVIEHSTSPLASPIVLVRKMGLYASA